MKNLPMTLLQGTKFDIALTDQAGWESDWELEALQTGTYELRLVMLATIPVGQPEDSEDGQGEATDASPSEPSDRQTV